MQADTKKNKSKYINGEVLKYIILSDSVKFLTTNAETVIKQSK